MKRILNLLVISALSISSISVALAAPGQGKKGTKSNNGGQLIDALTPLADGAADLATSSGRLHYRSKKGKTFLKVRILIPEVSASLGIADDATAALAVPHLEVVREGLVLSDCTLVYQAEDAEEAAEADGHKYRLHVKSHRGAAQDKKGSCGGTMPEILSTDQVQVYFTVADVRVNALEKAAQE